MASVVDHHFWFASPAHTASHRIVCPGHVFESRMAARRSGRRERHHHQGRDGGQTRPGGNARQSMDQNPASPDSDDPEDCEAESEDSLREGAGTPPVAAVCPTPPLQDRSNEVAFVRSQAVLGSWAPWPSARINSCSLQDWLRKSRQAGDLFSVASQASTPVYCRTRLQLSLRRKRGSKHTRPAPISAACVAPCCLGVWRRPAHLAVAGCWPGGGRRGGKAVLDMSSIDGRNIEGCCLIALSGTWRRREEVISDERSRDPPTTSFASMRLVLRGVHFFRRSMFAEHLQLDLSCCDSLKDSQFVKSCCAGWRPIEATVHVASVLLSFEHTLESCIPAFFINDTGVGV